MLEKLKYYLSNFTTPLLYYIDKEGHSVFRNFCLFDYNGNCYDKVIPVKQAGKMLEYRIELGKHLKYFNLFVILLAYFLYIHLFYCFWGLIFCELIAIITVFLAKIYYSNLFKKSLNNQFGDYNVIRFTPPITEEKQNEYEKIFFSRIFAISLLILVFIGFSFISKGIIRYSINKEKPNYKTAQIISYMYELVYPKTSIIYEFRACKYYSEGDFNKAVINYIKALKLQKNKLTDKDFTRFANLLYLVKKSSGSQNAIDIFNEYTTKKKTDIIQQSKLLWIKSMFSIANGIPDFVEQDYDDLLTPLDDKDINRFYILCDKAYMMYLKKDYNKAMSIYNYLISYAKENEDLAKELPRLYIERGYTKQQLNDRTGANWR